MVAGVREDSTASSRNYLVYKLIVLSPYREVWRQFLLQCGYLISGETKTIYNNINGNTIFF